jgi:hypothetical protein
MTSATCYHLRVRWVVFILLAMGVADAGPQVEIRARTQLSLSRVRRVDNTTIEVMGSLRDKLTGDGIPHQRVTVTIAGTPRTTVTGPDGGFTEAFDVAPGTIDVHLDFPGGTRLESAEPLVVKTDPAKVEMELSLVKTRDDPAGAQIRIDAQSTESMELVQVDLAIAAIGDDAFRPLRKVETGEELVFTRKEAGGAGIYRLRASFPGDGQRQAALAVVTIELASGSHTTIEVSSTNLAFEDDLDVTGTVTDDDGAPLKLAAVTLMSGDRRLAQRTTDDRGAYRFSIEAEIVGQGQFGIQVQADPGFSYVRSSRSKPTIIRIAAPQPVPVSWTVAAFIATVVAAGGFFAARTKPWQRLRRAQPPADVPSQEGEIEVASGGLVTAKPGVVATLRRPNDDGFSGVVRDTVRGRPVADALVTLTFGDRERSIRTAEDGSFAIETLDVGEWRAEVTASGHISEKFAVTLPHRGELRGVRVDLVPVRERVFQIYRRAAEPILPESRLWGIWSPRQIVDHVRAKRPSPALAELTDFVEEIYFSPRLAEEAVLPQAEGRVTRALNERARTPPR